MIIGENNNKIIEEKNKEILLENNNKIIKEKNNEPLPENSNDFIEIKFEYGNITEYDHQV